MKREGVTVFIDGAPTLQLNQPIATRPQDWAPATAALIFDEEAIRRAERRRA